MTRLSFKDMRKFRDPRTGGPLQAGTIIHVLSRGAAKAISTNRGDAVVLYDEATDRKYSAKALSVRLTYLQNLGSAELSMLPTPNTGTPQEFVSRLQARYGDHLGSILTLLKLEIVS